MCVHCMKEALAERLLQNAVPTCHQLSLELRMALCGVKIRVKSNVLRQTHHQKRNGNST